MKKIEVITIDAMINNIKAQFKQEDYKPFSYAFLRNQLKFKNVITEKNEIVQELLKSSGVEEDKLEEYLLNNEDFKKFLEEEVEIDLYTIKLDSLESQDFNLQIAEWLVGVNILKE